MARPAFILAGGPSVKLLDLSRLEGQFVIAINSAWRSYRQADVLFYADDRWWTQLGRPALGENGEGFDGEIVTTASVRPRRAKIRRKVSPSKGLSDKLGDLALSSSSVSGAINEAVQCELWPLFLLGVDGEKGAERHHHGEAYPWPLVKGCFDKHRSEFEIIAADLKRRGIPCFNVNPASAVHAWPKIDFEEALRMAQAATARAASAKPLVVLGMYGMGDSLHQRAVVRELMRSHQVELQTFYTAMYHDLEAEGLKVVLSSKLPPRIRDQGNGASAVGPTDFKRAGVKIGYDHALTKKHGTLLGGMFGSVGLPVPEQADFSLPVKPEWRAAARALLGAEHAVSETNGEIRVDGKPLMMYRPIVLNGTWPCPSRAPDPEAYAALYASVRERFFTVSFCELSQKGEHIVGDEQPADLKIHHGEADFETLTGLFAEAAIVFGNAGFTPILAQTVGTPNIVVYGGNESFRYTNIVGSHLAPTLPIEPLTPCACFDRHHKCDKTIDIDVATAKVQAFADAHSAQPRILLFGTSFVDTPDKQRLAGQWEALHRAVNGWTVDLLLVDSSSPVPFDLQEETRRYVFPDNIGHLARGGRDGWGRAFCKGLEIAIDGQYDYVVHVEGDSLLKRPVLPIIRQLMFEGVKAATVPVQGTKRPESGWAETGLMFLEVEHLWRSGFIERYDWWKRTPLPTPETVIFDLLGDALRMLPLKAERGDRGQITAASAPGFDWITHCAPAALDAFVEAALPAKAPEPAAEADASPNKVKVNLGCGTNRLDGWQNFDAELDITRPLPFGAGSVDFIFAEHVVEHVDQRAAIAFFRECRRVLKPGGVVRICVPSIENIRKRGDQGYFDFAKRWGPSADLRGAMDAIVYAHGHQAAWNRQMLEDLLFFAGFDRVEECEPHKSRHADLAGVEGHHKVIGERFNWIESLVVEAAA